MVQRFAHEREQPLVDDWIINYLHEVAARTRHLGKVVGNPARNAHDGSRAAVT